MDIAARILASGGGRIPNTMAEVFEALEREGFINADRAGRMKRAVGFRNIAVHAYEKIDWGIVQEICKTRLGDFEEFAGAIHLQ